MSTHSYFFFALYFLSLFSHSYGTQLRIVNNCSESVWPGILGNSGHQSLNNGGFHLPCGEIVVTEAPENWSGRIWGRQGCCFDEHGRGSCQTGDCAGLLECRGTGGLPPATLVEMTLGTSQNPLHYYDVSLVDGFNLPVAMIPVDCACNSGGCGIAACEVNLNAVCPASLAVQGEGKLVGCKSECLATKAPQHCCTGDYANPRTCKPSIVAQMFKAICPRTYCYAYDEPTGLNRCTAAEYIVTFCPSNK